MGEPEKKETAVTYKFEDPAMGQFASTILHHLMHLQRRITVIETGLVTMKSRMPDGSKMDEALDAYIEETKRGDDWRGE